VHTGVASVLRGQPRLSVVRCGFLATKRKNDALWM